MVDYPVPAFHRFYSSWDDILYYGVKTHTSALVQSSVSTTYRDYYENDSYSGTPLAIPADGGISITFRNPVNISAYLLDLISGTAPMISVTFDTVPSLSTGTWLTAGPATLTSIANYRTPFVLSPQLSAITAIRFDFTGTAEIGNFHLYGDNPEEKSRFVRGSSDIPLVGTDLNFGTGGLDGWSDITFSVQNLSSVSGTSSVYLEFLAYTDTPTGTSLLDEIFVSNNGVEFISIRERSYLYLPAVPVGGVSGQVTVRRWCPADHDNSRSYVVHVGVDPSMGGYDDTSLFLYVGDSDPTVPEPQLWQVTPDELEVSGTLTLQAAGCGATQAAFNSNVVLWTPGGVPMTLPVVSWTPVAANPALAGTVTDVDTLNLSTGVLEPSHVTITATVPEGTPVGSYFVQVFSVGTTPVLSESLPVEIIALPPAAQDGFRLQAETLAGVVLESNVPYQRLAFTDELSDVGAGKPAFDYTAPFWNSTVPGTLTPAYIADNEFIWKVYEGDQLRFAFLNSIADDSIINTELSRKVDVNSEGIGKILSWSVVAPPRFPTVPPYYWSFAHARLWQWLTIWAECATRTPTGSAQKRFRPRFTRYTDSAGNKWLDEGFENQQKNGVDMLTLLKEHCDSVGADFHINPDFTIDVTYSRATVTDAGKYFGRDLPQVIFRASHLSEKRVLRDRSEVGNWVISQDDYGEVTLKYDSASIAKNGMRERYVEAGRNGSVSMRVSRANEELKWHTNAIVSWTLKVNPLYTDSSGGVFNRVFVDYRVGDWIYVDVEGSDSLVTLQVSAITMAIESDGFAEVELTLESLASLRRRKAELKDAVQSGSSSGSGGASLVLFEEEIFPVESASPPTTYDIRYLPLNKSEIVTIGMKKYMEVDGSGGLGVREFTRTLRRGVHWKRTGWTITILDPSVFDESF